MNTFQENEKMLSIGFSSMSDFLQHDFQDGSCGNVGRVIGYKERTEPAGKWFGRDNTSAEQVTQKALVGDSDMLKLLEENYIKPLDKALGKNTLEYKQQIKTTKRRRCFGDQGDELDMDKVYSGELDTCWTKMKREEFDHEHNLITIAMHIGASANKDAVDSYWKSAIAVKLVDELQLAGKSVRLVLMASTKRGYENTVKDDTVFMVVKEMDERLSMQKLAAMTHLGFFRAVFFQLKCFSKYRARIDLGVPCKLTLDNMPLQYQDEIAKGHMKFVIINEVETEYAAVNMLADCYKQLKANSGVAV